VEGYLSLLDQSRPFESVVEDFQLFDRQVSIHFYYDAFDPYASGREAGQVGSVLQGSSVRRNDKVSLLLSRITIGFPRKATRSVTLRKVGQY